MCLLGQQGTILVIGLTRCVIRQSADSRLVIHSKISLDMFKKGNVLYAEAGHYLRHSSKALIALAMQGEMGDFVEHLFDTPLDVEIQGNMVFYQHRDFVCRVTGLDYNSLKTSMIKSRYSNDDQIAIMLNKDNGGEGAMLYEKMQEWREWAGEFATRVMAVINDTHAEPD